MQKCFIDYAQSQESYADCVFDYGVPSDCEEGKKLHEAGKCKTDCKHWHEGKCAENELIEAAIAVIERWESPNWKDLPHTGEFINRLRLAVEAFKNTETPNDPS